MQVETYEIEQFSSEASEMVADTEASELITKLGLSGQTTLMNADTGTRNPYRLISKEEVAVYEACFPNKTKLEDYKDGIIPLRVLQVASHAKESGFFTTFTVWHPAPGKVDPVLVGCRTFRPDGWNWDRTDMYILARWGESLIPLEELKAKAKKILCAQWRNKMEQTRADIDGYLPRLESIADVMLNGGDPKGTPYFSW